MTEQPNKDNWHEVETYKSLMQYGASLLRFVLWANGGGAVALLTFAGNVFLKTGQTLDMRWPMACFLAGVLAGGFATLSSYYTQLTLYREDANGDERSGVISHAFWLRVSLVLVLVGLGAFGAGSIWAVVGIAPNDP